MLSLSKESLLPEGKYYGSGLSVEDAIKGNYQYMVDSIESGLFELDDDADCILAIMKRHMEQGGEVRLMSFIDAERARTRCREWLDFQGLTLEDGDLDIKVTDEDRYMDYTS